LLVFGIALFGCAYGVYSRFLGGIDGLPQLPVELLARRSDTEPFVAPPKTLTDQKLLIAFGPNCLEVDYSYKLELPAKGIVIATNQYSIDPDGRLKLTPFSLATLKERTPGMTPEINSIHCDVGYLEFDKPVKTLQEIGSRRIVACELIGDPGFLGHDPRRGSIHLANNRGTPPPDDDLVLVTSGPVSYRESSQPGAPLDKARPEISTTAAVQIVDRRHSPESTTVTARGMKVYLALETPPPDGKRRTASRNPTITGVRRVVLPADVNMNLWLDSSSGFLSAKSENGGRKTETDAPISAARPSQRSNLQITTIGPFTYDLLPDGDTARFDRLPPSATPLPNTVRVFRPHRRGPDSVVNDQLECDHLELKFATKSVPNMILVPTEKKSAQQTEANQPKERTQVEWVHAWGQFVVLTSDEEKLEARGNDLFHDASAKSTTLTGQPETVALKDGNEIHAPVLVLYGADSAEGQRAVARGAGHFRMNDRTGKQRTIVARWTEELVYRKEPGRDQVTLTGQAVFEDPAGGQKLQADSLRILLSPDSRIAKSDAPTDGAKRRPQRIEAFGHVSANAPDLVVHDTDELIVHFKDLPSAVSATAAAAPTANPVQTAPALLPTRPNADPKKKTNPIDLRARRIQAFLLVGPDDQTQLDDVHCEDNVHVHQDPTPPQVKPIDMDGQKLHLKHTAEGNILEVTGNLQTPGEVKLPDLELIGPFIRIDQIENVAEVQGIGSMRLESQTDMHGQKLDKPTPLMITWKNKMRFNGQLALFHGHVQADQGDTSLLCNNMQVFLNRAVSLNQKPGQPRQADSSPANIDKVICDNQGQELPQPVSITESVRSPDGRLQRYQRIETNTVALHKEENTLDAGPGSVRILQQGPKGEGGLLAQSQPNRPAKKADDEFKLTWIRYVQRLQVDNGRRTAKFYKGVEVLHLPKDDPGLNLEFNKIVDRLPKGAVYLRCDRLDVYSSKNAEGRTVQEFTARDRAEVQAEEFSGRASVIKFDEAKETVVFEGTPGALAELYRIVEKGKDPQTIKAEKITYFRQTGAFKTEGTGVISTGGQRR
jgi:lipopolysaccharide export system protein LptA